MTDYFAVQLPPEQIRSISSIGLAHIGDAVYELLVRTYLCVHGKATGKGLHRATVEFVCAPQQARFAENLPVLQDMARVLYDAINENPPMRLSDGHVIRAGYNAELDELRSLKSNGSKSMEDICAREREKTGISTMKVGYTSVFGYYFAVSYTHLTLPTNSRV